MAADLEHAGSVFEDAALRYETLATGMEALHADVVTLSKTLTKINRLAAIDGSGLGPVVRRSGGRLPSVAKSAPKSGAKSGSPPAHATTGAS